MLDWIIWNRIMYLYKMDSALNNLQKLICHNTQTNKQAYDRTIHTLDFSDKIRYQ